MVRIQSSVKGKETAVVVMMVASFSLCHLSLTHLLLDSLAQRALIKRYLPIAIHGPGALLHQPVFIYRASAMAIV